jgi:hypothetical protein
MKEGLSLPELGQFVSGHLGAARFPGRIGPGLEDLDNVLGRHAALDHFLLQGGIQLGLAASLQILGNGAENNSENGNQHGQGCGNDPWVLDQEFVHGGFLRGGGHGAGTKARITPQEVIRSSMALICPGDKEKEVAE